MALRKALIFSDTHIPYHNKRSWSLLLKVGRYLKPYYLLCLGDLMDSYSISAHDKDPDRANRFGWELDQVNIALDELDDLKAKDKRFVEGNHEDRVRREVMKNHSLNGVLSIPKMLRLKERGWKYTPYKEHDRIGKVYQTHDVGGSARNHKFKALDLYQHSVLTGHDHRMIYVVENNALGTTPKLSAGFGWLGDVEQVDYMTKAKARASWAQGFGVGYLDSSTGYFYTQPVPILQNYSCVVEGKLFR